MTHLSPKEFHDKLNLPDHVLIDVRTPAEYQQGHIKGAILADINNPTEFMSVVEKLDKDKHYLIYCRSGARSTSACAYLENKGFKNVYNLRGGILEWEFDIEK